MIYDILYIIYYILYILYYILCMYVLYCDFPVHKLLVITKRLEDFTKSLRFPSWTQTKLR